MGGNCLRCGNKRPIMSDSCAVCGSKLPASRHEEPNRRATPNANLSGTLDSHLSPTPHKVVMLSTGNGFVLVPMMMVG